MFKLKLIFGLIFIYNFSFSQEKKDSIKMPETSIGNEMNKKNVTEYLKADSKYLSEIDFEYLNKIRALLTNKAENNQIKSLIKEYQYKPKNGITADIEFDINGYFELKNNETTLQVVKKKYQNKNKSEIYELILNRINSIKIGAFELPETVYEIKTIGIYYESKLIRVNEIQRKNWEYILYASSIDSLKKYFVEFVYGTSGGVYTRIKEINLEDSETIKHLSVEKIEQLIMKYK